MMRISVLVLVLGVAVSASAQDTVDTTVLSFQDAIKIALMNGVTLNQQKNNLELAQLAKTSSIASLGPNINLNGQGQRYNGNSFDQQQGRAINGIRDNVSGNISANLLLFNGFGKINTLKRYANALDAQSYFVNRAAQDVINTVALQYLQVLLDTELARIAKENWKNLEQQLIQIKAFVEVGSKAPVDALNQNALTKGAELRYVQAEVTLTSDRALLIQTLQVDPFDLFSVQKPVWNINEIALTSTDPAVLLATAKQHRGDYLQAEKLELAQKYAMRAARSYGSPSLAAFAQYGSAYNFIHDVPDSLASIAGINRPFQDQFKVDNVYKVFGLQLQIPIFSGLQNHYAVIQQKTLYKNAELTAKNAEVLLKNDIVRTMRNFDGIRTAYLVSLEQQEAAKQAFDYETERYNLGVTNLVDYSTANRVYVQAQTDAASAEYRLLFQKIQLEYALGTLQIEDFD
jgi:outer membrane protein